MAHKHISIRRSPGVVRRGLICLVGAASLLGLVSAAKAGERPAGLFHPVQYGPEGVAWVGGSGGSVPPGALAAGQEAPPGSEPLYVCRAAYLDSLQPGKVRPGLDGCDFPYGGREITIPQYQVLVGGGFGWLPASGGYVPPNALQGGNDIPPQSPPLYICRAGYNGGVHPGKIRAGFNGCDISWGGREIFVPNYAVLVH